MRLTALMIKSMVWGLLAMAATFWTAPWALADEAAVMACDPTLVPLMERVALALAQSAPPLELTLRETECAQAVQSLVSGEAALAGLARPLSPLEEAQARGKSMALHSQRVGTDCLLAVVHPNNPIFNLTMDELRRVFSGQTRNWREVGGKDKAIVVVSRPPSTCEAQIWLARALDRHPIREDASVQESHEDVLQFVAGNKLAIGYVSLGFLDPSVKALSLGGVNPGETNVKSGRYPLCRPLLLVAAGKPAGAVKAAMDYLASPAGQALVRETGFLPLK